MNESPPSSVRFSSDEIDDYSERSELTWPWGDDEFSQGDFDLLVTKRADDPDYCDKLDGMASRYQPKLSSKGGCQAVTAVPLEEKGRDEIVELKLQLAKQQETIDLLSSKLSQSQIEIEALKAEKTALIDEVAVAREAAEERSQSSGARRFSLFANSGNNGGSMQLLLDTNSKLMADNSRLQVSVDGLRKSFQSYIKFSARSTRADKETIEALQQENKSLRKQCGVSLPEKTSLGDDTAKTSMESDDPTDEDQANTMTPLGIQDLPTRENKYLDFSENTWIIEGIDLETGEAANKGDKVAHDRDTDRKGPTRRRSDELLVEFGEPRRRCKSKARRWHSIVL